MCYCVQDSSYGRLVYEFPATVPGRTISVGYIYSNCSCNNDQSHSLVNIEPKSHQGSRTIAIELRSETRTRAPRGGNSRHSRSKSRHGNIASMSLYPSVVFPGGATRTRIHVVEDA